MNTEELKKLADAATPGPWHQGGLSGGARDTHWMREIRHTADGHQWGVAWIGRSNVEQAHADAAYIACANPTAILALIAERDELLAALEEIVEYMQSAGFDWSLDKARAAITKAEAQ